MRRQRPLRYTLALFATAVSVVASPAALVAAEDGAATEPHLPVEPPEASAPRHQWTSRRTFRRRPTVSRCRSPHPTRRPRADDDHDDHAADDHADDHSDDDDRRPRCRRPHRSRRNLLETASRRVRHHRPRHSGRRRRTTDDLDAPMGIDGITRAITFPVLGPVSYSNDWGACRDGCARHHQGTDILGVRMQPLLAAVDGTVTRVRLENAGICRRRDQRHR